MKSFKTTFNLSQEIGISTVAITQRAIKLHIKKTGNSYKFNEKESEEIRGYKRKVEIPKVVVLETIKHYPLKTTETFYIYESKINNM